MDELENEANRWTTSNHDVPLGSLYVAPPSSQAQTEFLFNMVAGAVPFGAYAIIQEFNIPVQAQSQIFMALCLISFSQILVYSKFVMWSTCLPRADTNYLKKMESLGCEPPFSHACHSIFRGGSCTYSNCQGLLWPRNRGLDVSPKR